MSRRGRGKQVTGIEMAFICCQAVAAMMLLGILMQLVSAKLTFGSGVEYLPVTITWTDSESHKSTYMEDGKKRTKITYYNSYSYTVDGVEYNNTMHVNYSVTPGNQETWYYNSKDPNKVSTWSSAGDMMGDTMHVWILFGIFQVAAIGFKIKIEQRKRLIKLDNEAYEEKIRRDIQKNREIYQTLNLATNRERLFAILEPLRIRICKNQKKIDSIMKRANVQVFLVDIIVKAIDSYRLPKLKDKQDADYAAFYMEYKKGIVEPILQQFFGEICYKPAQGLSDKELLEFDQYWKGGRLALAESEDYLEGAYKGVGYRQADLKEKNRSDASALYNETTRFHGRISIFDFKKKLDGDIIIKSQESSRVNVRDMKKVEMENIQFNSRFDVYAANEHTAYYLLTPQFMEYLLQLDIRRETVLGFLENKIVFLRNGVNGIFEADMDKPLDVQYEIGKSYNELKEIMDFIDVLKLERVEDREDMEVFSLQADEQGMKTPDLQDDEPDMKVSGLQYGAPGNAEDTYGTDDLDDWNKPVSQTTGSHGLKLRL